MSESQSVVDAPIVHQLTPREQFENVFGTITDDQWQWTKEFVIRQGFIYQSKGVNHG